MLASYYAMRSESFLIQDFERYLKKKKRIIGNSTHGFDRGQQDLILQIIKRLKKLKKEYQVSYDDKYKRK